MRVSVHIYTEKWRSELTGLWHYEGASCICPACDEYVHLEFDEEGIGEPTDDDCPHYKENDGGLAYFEIDEEDEP